MILSTHLVRAGLHVRANQREGDDVSVLGGKLQAHVEVVLKRNDLFKLT